MMGEPQKPSIEYDYVSFQQEQQSSPFPGTQLQNDLLNLKRGVDDTIDALKDVRRSDGKLNNGLVTPDSLSEGTKLLIGAPADSIEAIETVAQNIAAVDDVADSIADVNGVAAALPEVATVAANVEPVGFVSANVAALIAAAANMAAIIAAPGAADAAQAAQVLAQAAQVAAEAAATSVDYRVVADRAAAKLLNPTLVKAIIIVGEGGRDGTFALRTKSAMSASELTGAAADASEGIYIPIGADHYAVRQAGWSVEGASAAWWGVDTSAVDTSSAYQAAIDACAAIGIAKLFGVPGENILGAAINMRPGVTIDGVKRTVEFKQADGADVGTIFEFYNGGLGAAGARIVNCIIDGNRDNNADDINAALVHLRTSDDAEVRHCTFKNSNGYGVVTSALRSKIIGNVITNTFMHAVVAYNNHETAEHVIRDNIATDIPHFLLLQYADRCEVCGNMAEGVLLGSRFAPLTVDTDGLTVTWVSGPDFSTLLPGMYLVIDGGKEYRIDTVTDATHFEVEGPTLPTLSGASACAGSGDLYGCIESGACTFLDNGARNCATFGMGLWVTGDHTASGCIYRGNRIEFTGKNGFNATCDAEATGWIDALVVDGNTILSAGCGGGGIGATDKISIFLAAGRPGGLMAALDRNYCASFAGTGQTEYWLGTDGLGSFGSVSVGKNRIVGHANPGIYNDVISIALSAEWGDTAATSGIVSYGHAVRFLLTPGGTGIAAGANFTVNKIVTTVDQAPFVKCTRTSASSDLSASDFWGEQLSTPGAWVAHLNGTPVSGNAMTLTLQG